jgi:hypothetical protein
MKIRNHIKKKKRQKNDKQKSYNKLVFCVVFCRSPICLFSFGHFIVCTSLIYDFWLSFYCLYFFDIWLLIIILLSVLLRYDFWLSFHERLSSKTTQIKVKKQLVVRKDIDKNVHERLSSKTTQIKVKKQLVYPFLLRAVSLL